MKINKILSMALAAVMTMSLPVFAEDSMKQDSMMFNFTSEYVQGAKKVRTIEKYDYNRGYGFVNVTTAMPERTVNMSKIKAGNEGFTVVEQSVPMFNTVDKNAGT